MTTPRRTTMAGTVVTADVPLRDHIQALLLHEGATPDD